MAININSEELKVILDTTPAEQNIMLTGRHGIGKSQILTAYYKGLGLKVVALFLGQMSDPGDLIGLPTKNEETGNTDFMPPYWFPMDGKPIVLFLDELNRARPEILQTIMDLALNRKLAGRLLPSGSRVISAVNSGEEYQLTDLDPALVSRFNIYNFMPTTEEWLLWASKAGLDRRVIDFIQDSPSFLDGDDVSKSGMDTGLEKSPDRRAWQKVSDCISSIKELDSTHKKLIAGIVGAQAANKFSAFVTNNQLVTGQEVLLHFSKCKAQLQKYQLHQLSAVNDSIFRALETETFRAKDEETAKKNIQLYVKFLLDNSQREAMAHFASVFEKGSYPAAIMFVMTKVPEIYQEIMKFISGI